MQVAPVMNMSLCLMLNLSNTILKINIRSCTQLLTILYFILNLITTFQSNAAKPWLYQRGDVVVSRLQKHLLCVMTRFWLMVSAMSVLDGECSFVLFQ